MSRPPQIVLMVTLVLRVCVPLSAEHDCQSDVCEDVETDDFAFLQTRIEPDFVANVGERRVDIDRPKVNLVARTVTVKPEVKGTTIRVNMEGDLPAFLAALRSCSLMFIVFVVVFMVWQRRYPKIFGYRIAQNWRSGRENLNEPKDFKEDDEITPTWWNWARLSLSTNNVDVEESSGLDAAMLLKFSELAMELMLVLGLPLCIVGCPIYAFNGGGFAWKDRLSWAGIGNIVWNETRITGEPMWKEDEDKLMDVQWIFWFVASTVWVVVLWTQHRLFVVHSEFITRRRKWLLNMDPPRSTTVLVQGIPAEHRSDKKFAEFFSQKFHGVLIHNAFVMKNLSSTKLPRLWAKMSHKEQALSQAKFSLANVPNEKWSDCNNSVLALKDDVDGLAKEICEAQENIKRILADPSTCEKLYTSNGFVTFARRSDCERVLAARMSEDEDEWIFEIPPDPADVRYHDFEVGNSQVEIYQILGYIAVAGLFFVFMPLVVSITYVSEMIRHAPALQGLMRTTGMTSTIDGVLAAMGLDIMMAFLPTFLMWIFQMFFVLKADRWAQLRLQQYYFWFLVLFVLLVTAVGTNLAKPIDMFLHSPCSALLLLAEHMPVVTHFYLKYVLFQPAVHGMNLTRYGTLFTFVTLNKICDEDRARELSEPEDQDYYGVGSRSARWTLMLLIGLVFGTICPLMHIVVFCNFAVCRLVYGYLIPFAETRKPDQGGEHWCLQMVHTHHGLLIYIVMMTGILVQRSESSGPGIMAALSFLFWCAAYRKFTRALHWDRLPYGLAMMKEEKNGHLADKTWDTKYHQKELEPHVK